MTNTSHPIPKYLVTQTLDSQYGVSGLRIPLKQYIGGPLRKLQLTVTLGTLSGGSSPAFVTAAADKIFTNIQLQSDIYGTLKNGSYSEFKTKYQIRNFNNALPAGTHVLEFESPVDGSFATSGNYRSDFLHLYPSDLSQQIDLVLNVQTLANLTTGSPTSTSGTQVNITSFEERAPAIRAAEAGFQPLYEVAFPPTSLGSSAQIPVNLPQGYLYRNVLTEAYDGTTLSDSLITGYEVMKDNDTDIVNTKWKDQQQLNIMQMNTSSALGTGLAFTDFQPMFDATTPGGSLLTMNHTYGTASTSNSTKFFMEYTTPMQASHVAVINKATS